MICGNCSQWQQPEADAEAGTLRCAACGCVEHRRFPPLFILTGPSGAGKSAVIPALRGYLRGWEVFETDILWDSAGDYQTVRGNWLRIALSVAESSRPTLLCGVHVPETIDACVERRYFHRIHYLALDCQPTVREQRLRARPPWRGITEAFIEEQHTFARWLEQHAQSAFDPALTLVDTSTRGVAETARLLAAWARARCAEDWPPPARRNRAGRASGPIFRF